MRLFYQCLWLLCIALGPALSHAQQLDPQQQRLDDLQRFVTPGEYELLNVGDNAWPVLLHDSHLALSRGSLILLLEDGAYALSPSTYAPLTKQLNDNGWTVLSSMAPLLPITQSNELSSPSDEQTVLPIHGSTWLRTEQRQQHSAELQLLTQALLNRAADIQGFVVILAQGTTAAWLTQMFAEQQLTGADALITVGPFWPQSELNRQVPDFVAEANVPILDIHNQWDNAWAKATMQDRRIAAVKKLKLHFRQRELIGMPYSEVQANYLTKEMLGWFSFMGW